MSQGHGDPPLVLGEQRARGVVRIHILHDKYLPWRCIHPELFFAQLLVDIFDSISLIGQYYYVLLVITRPLDKRLLSSGSASLDAALLEVEARKAK